jgi:lipoate-protein ligase A
MGNLNYSFITDAAAPEERTASLFTYPVVQALQALGLDAECSGRNDILVSGRKVSGTAQQLHGGRILHHGTLLFDSNPDMVVGALHVDPAKFQSKSAKSVRSRIGNIRTYLQQDMNLAAFWEYLKTTLTKQGLFEDVLTNEELAEVEALRREKYATWEWNFGRSPKFDLTNKRRFSGGSLEVGMCVESGYITQIAFYGDFLGVSSLDQLTEGLKGYFQSKGLEVIDKRDNGGCLWVVGDENKLKPYIDEVKKLYGAYGKFGAGRATKQRCGWFTKCKK